MATKKLPVTDPRNWHEAAVVLKALKKKPKRTSVMDRIDALEQRLKEK
jgi:IS5 family transposase